MRLNWRRKNAQQNLSRNWNGWARLWNFPATRFMTPLRNRILKSRKQNKSALLVAPTWAEIEAVTEKVRAELKSSGVLGSEENEFRVFDSLSWTEAQKRDVRQYRAGQVLNFHRTTHGFSKGESAEVVQVSDDSLKLRRPDGSEASVQLGRGSAAFDVGEARTLKIAGGR